MRPVAAIGLTIATAVACLAPKYEIVDSFGDAGDGGTAGDTDVGTGGSSTGGRAGNGGSVSPPTGGDGGDDPGTGGSPPETGGGGSSGSGAGGASVGGNGTGGRDGSAGGGGGGSGGGGSGGGGSGGGGSGGGGSGGGGSGGSGGGGGKGGVTCDATFAVSTDGFVRAPVASGCWHGHAYAGGDTGSTIMPQSFAMCGANCMLRASGTLGPANAANSYAGLMFIGFNIDQPAGSSTVGARAPTGTNLIITYTKAVGPATLRVQLDDGATRWCANLTASPAMIPYTMFNTACWDNTGTAYAKQPVRSVLLVVSGIETAQPIDLTFVSVRDM
jgi:hypothetical protein